MRLESEEQCAHNRSLWPLYPLGIVQGIYGSFEMMWSYLDSEEQAECEAAMAALSKLDDLIRSKRHPLPKRRTRRSAK